MGSTVTAIRIPVTTISRLQPNPVLHGWRWIHTWCGPVSPPVSPPGWSSPPPLVWSPWLHDLLTHTSHPVLELVILTPILLQNTDSYTVIQSTDSFTVTIRM